MARKKTQFDESAYLNDVNYSNKLNDNGWVNVTNDELETLEKKDKRSNKTNPSIPAMKVLYLSSLIKDIKVCN